MRRRAGVLTLFAIVIALSIHLSAASADAPIATVLSINGTADIERDGSAVVAVTTGADATVIVSYDSIHDVTIYQNSQVQFGDGLGLRAGTVRLGGTFAVTTANAQARVTDSEMTVAYDKESGYTTIEVYDRQAAVRGSSDESDLLVPTGQMVRVGADGIASAPQAISVDEIAAARVAAPQVRTTTGERRFDLAVTAFAAACLLAGLVGSRRSRRIAYLA